MFFPGPLLLTSAFGRALIGLLALVVGLQGFSVGIAKARGPSHVHVEPVRTLVLEDFRRSHYGTGVNSRISSWPGHSHVATQRHHHAAADPTVVVEAASAADAAAEDGVLLLDLVVAAFVALLMLAFYWMPALRSQDHARRSPWQPSFAMVRLLDRPPRAA